MMLVEKQASITFCFSIGKSEASYTRGLLALKRGGFFFRRLLSLPSMLLTIVAMPSVAPFFMSRKASPALKVAMPS